MGKRVTGTIVGLLFPLLIFAHEAQAASKKTGPTSQVLTVEAEPEAFPAARELSEKLVEIQAGSQNVRSKLLSLQDSLAARFGDVALLTLDIQTQNGLPDRPALGFLEVEALLDDVSLVNYINPPPTGRDTSLPIYSGPIPVGGYNLKVRTLVGVMLHDWPSAFLQGRWALEKIFRISIEKGKPQQNFHIILKPGDTEPSLVVTEKP